MNSRDVAQSAARSLSRHAVTLLTICETAKTSTITSFIEDYITPEILVHFDNAGSKEHGGGEKPLRYTGTKLFSRSSITLSQYSMSYLMFHINDVARGYTSYTSILRTSFRTLQHCTLPVP